LFLLHYVVMIWVSWTLFKLLNSFSTGWIYNLGLVKECCKGNFLIGLFPMRWKIAMHFHFS
jgi:hypothetical protein